MGEIKQTNFRIDSEKADAFRTFCETEGLNQAQGFERMMQALELQQAKAMVPGRAVEIEAFEHHAGALVTAYLNSVALMQDTEERIKEQFQKAIQSKEETIMDLQEQSKQKDATIEDAKKQAEEAKVKQQQAEKDAEDARYKQQSAEQKADDKSAIAEMLTSKLAEAEQKAAGFDELKSQKESLERDLQDIQTVLKEQQREFDLQTERTAREAEKAQEQVVQSARDELQQIIHGLHDELREAKDNLKEQERNAEKAQNEALQAVRKEMQQTINALQNKLQQAQISAEHQLREAEKSAAAEIRKLEQEKAELREQLAEARALIPKKIKE